MTGGGITGLTLWMSRSASPPSLVSVGFGVLGTADDDGAFENDDGGRCDAADGGRSLSRPEPPSRSDMRECGRVLPLAREVDMAGRVRGAGPTRSEPANLTCFQRRASGLLPHTHLPLFCLLQPSSESRLDPSALSRPRAFAIARTR